MRRFLLRGSRVVLHSVIGGALVAAGIVMLLTPGPGIVMIVLGLAVLAREYRWAERLERLAVMRIRDASTVARARLAGRRARRRPSAEPTPGPTGSGDRHDHDDGEAPGRMRPAS